jgi:hypothetical protein
MTLYGLSQCCIILVIILLLEQMQTISFYAGGGGQKRIKLEFYYIRKLYFKLLLLLSGITMNYLFFIYAYCIWNSVQVLEVCSHSIHCRMKFKEKPQHNEYP